MVDAWWASMPVPGGLQPPLPRRHLRPLTREHPALVDAAAIFAAVINKRTARVAGGPPTTAGLREVLNRVVIVDAPPGEADCADHARTEVTGAGIADLARLLAVVDGGTGELCLCDGWPTITVHGPNGDLIACWTLHHQSGLRGLGDCDADLVDGPALTDWLAGRGLTGSRRVQEHLAALNAAEDQRRTRWIQAAPAGLAEAAADVAQPPGRDRSAWSRGLRDAEEWLASLTRLRQPEATERIRALLAWAGDPAREATGGLKWYDLAVRRQLLAEDPDLVLTALATPLEPGPTRRCGPAVQLHRMGPSPRQTAARATSLDADRAHRGGRHRAHAVPAAARLLQRGTNRLTGPRGGPIVQGERTSLHDGGLGGYLGAVIASRMRRVRSAASVWSSVAGLPWAQGGKLMEPAV
ncbi:hypothetical protein ACIG5E_31525 [Kitasatospora sp. NPDC053057]|uniref:hypothetical protein n=1 Tax=Kitasatospora sp. NPDC053057 TaxID=3364062 RepID=UPI0037CB2604